MRPIATGRKNWIHIGSKQAGPRVAAILSVVESCRRLKIPVRDYLADILPGLANTSIQRVASSLPPPGSPDTRLPIFKLAHYASSTVWLVVRALWR
jgi:transposase